jgi:hypothetical protein
VTAAISTESVPRETYGRFNLNVSVVSRATRSPTNYREYRGRVGRNESREKDR